MLIVLSLLIVASILVAGSVAVSQATMIESRNTIDYEITSYYVESAANTARWMLALDYGNYPSRMLDLEPDKNLANDIRWQADGRIHKLRLSEDIIADVQLFDPTGMCNPTANRGPLMGMLINYYRLEDSTVADQLTELTDVLRDYADTDDFAMTNGMEVSDYEALGLYNLPRNGTMQYKEELYWIPLICELFPVQSKDGLNLFFQPIIADEMGANLVYMFPNFFSVPEQFFTYGLTTLSENEIDRIIEARTRYINEGISIKESLEEATITTIRRRFNLQQESGFYYIIVRLRLGENLPLRTLVFCIRGNGQSALTKKQTFYDWQML